MTDYLTLTNLIRLLVAGSLAWWLLVDIPRWWRGRKEARAQVAANVPRTPREPKRPRIKLSRKKAEREPEPGHEEEPVIVRRRSLNTIAAQHGAHGEGVDLMCSTMPGRHPPGSTELATTIPAPQA